MLRFYDLLRRQSQQVKRFEELITEALGSSDIDRGAQRMRDQTQFLANAFREYERRVRESGAVDEHLLRERLVTEAAPEPVTDVLITVADWIADADGLFVADFDLLARIPGLTSLDIVATERLLGSGLHERLHNWLPGIQESQVASQKSQVESQVASQMSQVESQVASHESQVANCELRATSGESRLLVPEGAPPDEPWWVHRDREEELIAVVRQIEEDRRYWRRGSARSRRGRVQTAATVSLCGAGGVQGCNRAVSNVRRAAACRGTDRGGSGSAARSGRCEFHTRQFDQPASLAALRVSGRRFGASARSDQCSRPRIQCGSLPWRGLEARNRRWQHRWCGGARRRCGATDRSGIGAIARTGAGVHPTQPATRAVAGVPRAAGGRGRH